MTDRPQVSSADLNAAIEAERDRMLLLEDELAARYRRVLRRYGRKAAATYRQHGGAVTAGARHDELYDPDELAADVTRETLRLRQAAVERMIGGVMATVGVSFDVAPLLVPGLLDHIGVRARDMNASMMDSLRRTIEAAAAEGWTVPQTASAISAGVNGMAGYTATMLARTDLIGLANGGSIVAAREVLGEGATKTWLATPDDRTRPTHVDADGQQVPLDQQFQVGDDLLDYPGDPTGSDEEVCNCRCTVLYDDGPVVAAAGAPDVTGLAMIAVYPEAAEAQALAVEGGQDPDTLHITMVFLGDVADVDMQAVERAVRLVAADTAPMAGAVGGVGAFAQGDNGWPQIALPNVKGLAELRTRLTDALADEGIVSPSAHDWVPHMTLAYADEADLPDTAAIGSPLTFAALSVSVEDVRTDYDLAGAVLASARQEEEGSMRNAEVTLEAGAPEIRVPILNDGNVVGYLTTTTTTDTTSTTAVPSVYGPVVAAAEDDGDEESDGDEMRWVSDIAFEGAGTGDGRFIVERALSWRQPPLTLMAQTVTAEGHDGAEVAGRMDAFLRDTEVDMDGAALPDGVAAIRAVGVFDAGEVGSEIGRMVDDEVLRGVSVDLAINEWTFRDPDTGEILDTDEMTEDQWDQAFFGELEFAILDAEIMAATVCPTPAFADARIAVVASAADGTRQLHATLWAPIRLAHTPLSAITASAAGMAPLAPPREWFDDPQLTELTPLTVTDDGRVFGHLAPWGACHTGSQQRCIPTPRDSDYSYFHLGALTCADGSEVAVGQITMDTGHATARPGTTPAQAIAHYDNTGTAVADVRCGNDAFGPWIAGALRPDVPAEKVRALKAAKVSGDWRPVYGSGHVLTGILTVNVPGYPVVRRAGYAVTASGVAVPSSPDGGAAAAPVGFPGDGNIIDGHAVRVLAARAEGGIAAMAALAEGEPAEVV